MPSLEEIRAEKVQVRLEKVALDAQIAKALKASEFLGNQLRQLKIEQAMRRPAAPATTSMDAYLGINGDAYEDDLPRLRRRERSKAEAIARWFSGRG
jgi:hypothetical protein